MEQGICGSKPDRPILTPLEAKHIVHLSEQYASELDASGNPRGWTTFRHYDVPTTDIPVHHIPEVLSIFNRVLIEKIAPMICSLSQGRCLNIRRVSVS